MSETVSKWLFRVLFALLALNLILAVYKLITAPPVHYECLQGIVMTYNPHKDMYTQPGLLVEHCVSIDRD
jgi:hypothetical protein